MTVKTAKTAEITYTKAAKAAAATARTLSQYYTDPKVAAACIATVNAFYGIDHFDTIIEPSAGTGAFSSQLGASCIALDIDPQAPGIVKADFLTWQPATPTGRCLVIGNPPFAKNAALATINHAAAFGDVIVLILPKSFCKKTQQNRVNKNLHLVYEEEIPAHAFTHEGKTVDVPCVLQIWERRPEEDRVMHELKSWHPDFECCAQAEADLVIRRVNAHAGQLKPLETEWSAESNIFLRAKGCCPEVLKARFARLDMTSMARNGAGGGSINMSEIVKLYEEELARERAVAVAGDGEAQPKPRHVVIEVTTGKAPSKVAIARFNAAAAEADSITLTVPRSFRKMSVQNQLDLSFHLAEDTDSVARIVGGDGRSRTLPCAVQTWVRRPEPRQKHALGGHHPDFVFCGRAEADVAIQRVGTAAGRLKTPTDAGSAQSHMFLRAVGCSPAELWARLDAIDFDTVRHNTAAVPSVAKPEIVALYEATRGLAAAAGAAPVERPSAPAGSREQSPRLGGRMVQDATAAEVAGPQASDRPVGAER